METETFDVIIDSKVAESEKNPICSICGSSHTTGDCTLLSITNHVFDKVLPTKARLSLPDDLRIETLSDGTNQVRTNCDIPKGTRFGPLDAVKTFTLNPLIQFPVKIFPYHEQDFLAYYFDTSDEHKCTWMMFVQPADTYEEQNLICYQDESDIYYATTKDVHKNGLLKVWYAPYYAQKMEKPILTMEKSTNTEVPSDINTLVKLQQKSLDRESWTCKFCGIIKTDMVDFGKHILEHYTTQLNKTCEICKASFTSRKSLRQHINIVHNQNLKLRKPAQDKSPEIPLNQNTLKEISIGGPLLNNLPFDDNFDNSNLLLPNLEYSDEDIQNLGSENLNVDNLLTENVRGLDHFNFGIGECQEEFVCDICVKSFAKLRYLIQHLKRHTGEYSCVSCKKVFCRKETLLNHACVKGAGYKCEKCDRTFIQKKNYNRHLMNTHGNKIKCGVCHLTYKSESYLNVHKCKNPNVDNNPRYPCELCNKSFMWHDNLKKHILKRHNPEKPPSYVCHLCGKEYMSKHAHDLHLKIHQPPDVQCDICDKKFRRKDVYLAHLELHTNQEYECNLCQKKFATTKSLTLHQRNHQEATFKCSTCNAIFRNKARLHKHENIHVKSLTKYDGYYTCPYCAKMVKLRSSLSRHIKRIHPDKKFELPPKSNVEQTKKTEDTAVVAPTSDDNMMTSTELDLIVSKDNIDSLNEVEMNELNSLQIEMIDNILMNTTKEMGIDDILNFDNEINCDVRNEAETTSIDTLADREICLSMPDLNDQDLDITLGDKAYILENGTIVEPQENSDNVIVYVLNQPKN